MPGLSIHVSERTQSEETHENTLQVGEAGVLGLFRDILVPRRACETFEGSQLSEAVSMQYVPEIVRPQ